MYVVLGGFALLLLVIAIVVTVVVLNKSEADAGGTTEPPIDALCGGCALQRVSAEYAETVETPEDNDCTPSEGEARDEDCVESVPRCEDRDDGRWCCMASEGFLCPAACFDKPEDSSPAKLRAAMQSHSCFSPT